MASYHLSVKPHSRSKNANAVALASYRSGQRLWDNRMQMYKDCRKNDKSAVLHSELFNSHRMNREQLWNAAESAEKRKNSVVAREVEIALPVNISDVQKVSLAREFCDELVSRYGCAIDLAVHAPDADGDQRNYHAHILMTTRQLKAGTMADKWRHLDQPKGKGKIEMNDLRMAFEKLQNKYLEKAGLQERVSAGRVEELDLPKKYVALPFKKYQVMRREQRVEEYKDVSGEKEFTRWKAQKELEIEDLVGEIETIKEQEQEEYGSHVDAEFQGLAEVNRREAESTGQENPGNRRRVSQHIEGLAEVNRRKAGHSGRENREHGERITEACEAVGQRASRARRERQQRRYISQIRERVRAVGQWARNLKDGYGRKIEQFKEGLISRVKLAGEELSPTIGRLKKSIRLPNQGKLMSFWNGISGKTGKRKERIKEINRIRKELEGYQAIEWQKSSNIFIASNPIKDGIRTLQQEVEAMGEKFGKDKTFEEAEKQLLVDLKKSLEEIERARQAAHQKDLRYTRNYRQNNEIGMQIQKEEPSKDRGPDINLEF